MRMPCIRWPSIAMEPKSLRAVAMGPCESGKSNRAMRSLRQLGDDSVTTRVDGLERSVEIRPYRLEDEAAVIALWDRCGLLRPWNDPKKDIQRKLRDSPDLFLVGTIAGGIVATVMAGYDGHRGWINYLGVCPDHQRQGLGRQIMQAAEGRLRDCGVPKINLQKKKKKKRKKKK
eukprot:TRINITY_DN42363_c3_g1_i1.p2 TRINITY_DN42363_c3_g1~~TRINITY_DN42363_c3_g1_i1.p2  ORF type:complete len:174 (-),score=2.49 TRINITY_DN42363_c3_g1_i1:6-527(-)